MSNKTRLQTNNNNLQSILDTVNALPEAGSGGSVETCTVNIIFDAPSEPGMAIYYIDNNMNLQTIDLITSSTLSLTVTKKTILAITPWTSFDEINGEITRILATYGCGIYYIEDNCSITHTVY